MITDRELTDKELIILILKDNPISNQTLDFTFNMIKQAIKAEKELMTE